MALAQLSTDSKNQIASLRKQITTAREHLHQAQGSRSELENLRETYAQGRDDYSEVVNAMQSKIDAYDVDLMDCNERIENRNALIDAYRKQIAAAET